MNFSNMEQKKKDNRGGKRPGAGRKMYSGSPRVTISARVAQETKERIDQLRKEGWSTGQLIDRMVADFQKKEE